MKFSRSTIVLVVIFSLVAITAFAILLWVTTNGIGISPDSIIYIETAENLLLGKGFVSVGEPMTHFPPGYPIILAGSGIFNPDLNIAARWLHTFLYAVNVILFGLSIFVSTRRNLVAMVLGFLVFFSSASVLRVHARAWSESPFLTFSLILFLMLGLYIQRKKWQYLLIASLALGFAMATRYVGITLAPAVVICLLFCNKETLKKKTKEVLAVLVIASLPMITWILRNLLITESAANRDFIFHPFSMKNIVTLVNTIHGFFLPQFDEGWFNGIELGLIVILFSYMVVQIIKGSASSKNLASENKFRVMFGYVFSITYIAVLLLSITFIDAYTPLDERILLPVFLFMSISIIATVFQFAALKQRQYVWLIFVVCTLFMVRINLNPIIQTAKKLHTEGLGLSTVAWNESPTMEFLQSLPPEVVVYSEADDVIRFRTDIEAKSLPQIYSPVTLVENEDYIQNLTTMCEDIQNNNALIVFFNLMNRKYYPTPDEFVEFCDVPVFHTTEDGIIFGNLQ